MSGLINAFASLFHGAANNIRNAALNPEQLEFRENSKRVLEMVKVASIVTTIAAVFLFAIFPKIFMLVFAGTVAFAASEVHKVADNLLEMLKKAAVEIKARSNKENCIDQIAKNTFIVGPLLRAIDPPFDGLILA
jgi:hypothetical protein